MSGINFDIPTPTQTEPIVKKEIEMHNLREKGNIVAFQQPFKVMFFIFRLLQIRILGNVITSIVDAEFRFEEKVVPALAD